MRPPTFSSSNRESSTPPPTTFSKAITLDKWFVPRPKIKTYFQKSIVLYDPIIEPEYQSLTLEETKIFPKGFNFLPEDLTKKRMFYKFILVDTKSIEITHVPYKNNPSKFVIQN